MKNIQVIDGAVNCVYDIFAATEEEFEAIFTGDQNIAFIDEVYTAETGSRLDPVFERIWRRPIPKCDAVGIHGILFYQLDEKREYYPTRRDEEAINPDGSRLR